MSQEPTQGQSIEQNQADTPGEVAAPADSGSGSTGGASAQTTTIADQNAPEETES